MRDPSTPPAPFLIQNYPSATFAGMGPFTKTLSSSTQNSSYSSLPALDMPIFLFAASDRTGQKAMPNPPHHHLPETPSVLEAKAHGHCGKQAPAVRGMCVTPPFTPQLIAIKTGQKRHPDLSLVHFVQFYSIEWKKKSGRNHWQTKCPNTLRCRFLFFCKWSIRSNFWVTNTQRTCGRGED